MYLANCTINIFDRMVVKLYIMAHPTHHFSIHQSQKKTSTKTIDMIAYFIGIFGNIAVIPQIIEAWQSSTPGLAILTWVLFTFFGVVWLMYAIIHKSKPLIIANAIGILCNVLVVSGWMFNHWNSYLLK
jgi:uncharacterized protein with PQ loop repeat